MAGPTSIRERGRKPPTYLHTYETEDARLSPNPFWITIHSGEATAIEEHYIP